jgi:hypothetical protein
MELPMQPKEYRMAPPETLMEPLTTEQPEQQLQLSLMAQLEHMDLQEMHQDHIAELL